MLTTDESRELIDACLESEGVTDHGSVRRDKAAAHFARDLEAFDERDAKDDDRATPWFITDPWKLVTLVCIVACAGLVCLAWMNL